MTSRRAAAGLLKNPLWKLVMVSQKGSGPCEECGISFEDLEALTLLADPEATVIPVRWTVVESECSCRRRAS
jgi:hypothetical protein